VAPIQPVVPGTPDANKPKTPATGPSKKALFIIVGAVVGLLLILVIVVALAGGNKKSPSGSNNGNGTQQAGPVPATALGVQQSNDAISQYLNSLNNQTDFPSDALSDQKLQIN
jgi:hypothetical protein